jgi:hypothetical protein
MGTAVVVSANTRQLLERAVAKLDVLGHRIAAAEIREAQERKDAQARADAAAYLTSREHMLDLQAVQRQYQARADDALQTWGERAPAPIAGESVDEYRMRLASLVQQRLPEGDEYRRLQLGGLPRTAFKNFEDAIYPRAKAAGASVDSVAAGELREVVQVNPINGHKEHLFYGRESFVKDLTRPGRRVKSFNTNRGLVVYTDAEGRLLR